MPACGFRLVVVLALLAAGAPGAHAQDFVRLRVFVVTSATSTTLTIEGATVTNLVASGQSAAGQLTISGGKVTLLVPAVGRQTQLTLDVVLTDVTTQSEVSWRVETLGISRVSLEVYNVNDLALARLVDRFDTTRRSAQFFTRGDLLRDNGPLGAGVVPSRLVLAHYYPWFDRGTWSHPWLLDQPGRPYSTDDSSDVTRIFDEAKAAGLDGLVVSWQGREFEDGWNHRRMLVALDAAQHAGLRASVLLETTVANPRHSQVDTPVDPEVVLAWLRDVLRLYAPHPAYLRADGRPVVFVYAANRLKGPVWAAILDALAADGFEPMLIAENTKSNWLESFAGQFDYASNRFTPSEIASFDREQALRIQSFHLLPGKGARRIWAATVSPGYDDTRLDDGRAVRVTPREQGAYYDAQWQAAFDSGADWILVTSWNEWWENTQIEPSALYGDAYARRTRTWADAFRARP